MGALVEMKGPARQILAGRVDGAIVELLAYADGSQSIMRNGNLVGVWEPSETQACLGEFAQLTGIREMSPLLSLVAAGALPMTSGSGSVTHHRRSVVPRNRVAASARSSGRKIPASEPQAE